MADFWNVPLSDERTMSIRQFCLAEDIDEDFLYGLACQGRVPKLTTIYGDFYAVQRISPEARRDWHKYMTQGFPDAHRQEALQQWFLDDGGRWRAQQEAQYGSDDDWSKVVEPEQGEQAENEAA